MLQVVSVRILMEFLIEQATQKLIYIVFLCISKELQALVNRPQKLAPK
jgi:hypothetical protein